MASTMRLALVSCVLAAALEGQDAPPADDAAASLREGRKKVTVAIRRLPRFLCTETVDRETFLPEANLTGISCKELEDAKKWKRRPYTSDRLRLDVAVSGDGEMYSWVGANRFHERSLARLVGGGATLSGAFSSFLTSIFDSDAAQFTYQGHADEAGRAAIRFGFAVPREKSGYRIGNQQFRAIVAYHGTILVDAVTHDLLRMTIAADRLPKELNTCMDTTVLDYGRAEFDNLKFLLPKDVILHVVHGNGAETENRTTFSGCHEFMGEATLSFEPPPESGQVAAPKKAVVAIAVPAGLRLRIALTHSIDTATAAAGDPVRAKLMQPIKDKHAGIIIPAGAAMAGRIVRLEWVYGLHSRSLMLSIQVETVEAGGASQPFGARLDSVVKSRKELGRVAAPTIPLGTFDQVEEEYSEQDVGVLLFEGAGKDFVIRRGLQIAGHTMPPPLS